MSPRRPQQLPIYDLPGESMFSTNCKGRLMPRGSPPHLTRPRLCSRSSTRGGRLSAKARRLLCAADMHLRRCGACRRPRQNLRLPSNRGRASPPCRIPKLRLPSPLQGLGSIAAGASAETREHPELPPAPAFMRTARPRPERVHPQSALVPNRPVQDGSGGLRMAESVEQDDELLRRIVQRQQAPWQESDGAKSAQRRRIAIVGFAAAPLAAGCLAFLIYQFVGSRVSDAPATAGTPRCHRRSPSRPASARRKRMRQSLYSAPSADWPTSPWRSVSTSMRPRPTPRS